MCFTTDLIKIKCDSDNKIKIDYIKLNELLNQLDSSVSENSTNLVKIGQEIRLNNEGTIDCKKITLSNIQKTQANFLVNLTPDQTQQLSNLAGESVKNTSSVELTNKILSDLKITQSQLDDNLKNIIKNLINLS